MEQRSLYSQAALGALVGVPLEVAELCRAIAVETQPLLECGHPPARPDGQVGIQLLEACQRTQCSLVRATLPALADIALIEAAQTRLEQLDTNHKLRTSPVERRPE